MDAARRRAGDDETLATRYAAVRARTERLAEPLSAEDCGIQSMTDASPTKWHLAHTSWYFETFVLEEAVPGYRVFREPFRVLFNSYYNSVGEQYARPARGLLSRPSLEEVLAYRRHVDRHMEGLLDKEPDLDPQLREVIQLGLHHEQQHQELVLTDLKHAFGCNPLDPAYHRKLRILAQRHRLLAVVCRLFAVADRIDRRRRHLRAARHRVHHRRTVPDGLLVPMDWPAT